MAQGRRYLRDRSHNRLDEERDYERGREYPSGRTRGRSEYGDASMYGRGRESDYPGSYGWGADYEPGARGFPGDRWNTTFGAGYNSDPYGSAERYERSDERSRGHSYGGRRQGMSEDRDMWDRASDEVSSWFGDEEAERRRRMDQNRGRGPKNYTRSEDRIREDVCDRLTDDWGVDASDIEVSVSGTEVTLSGTVPSRDQRRRAEDCAESVSGVSHVQNNTRVQDQSQETSGSFGRSLT